MDLPFVVCSAEVIFCKIRIVAIGTPVASTKFPSIQAPDGSPTTRPSGCRSCRNFAVVLRVPCSRCWRVGWLPGSLCSQPLFRALPAFPVTPREGQVLGGEVAGRATDSIRRRIPQCSRTRHRRSVTILQLLAKGLLPAKLLCLLFDSVGHCGACCVTVDSARQFPAYPRPGCPCCLARVNPVLETPHALAPA